MDKITILWADDEIDLLKPHILFLQDKGYAVHTTNNGADAIDIFKNGDFDMVFLDENMPGLSGLDTLTQIKAANNAVPVIMITKSEEEHIMESAIGSKIADYLIKPVNPNQILLSIKKNIDNKRLIKEKTTSAYQQEFRKLGMDLNDVRTHQQWAEMLRRLVYWELELEEQKVADMDEIVQMQKTEANNLFSRYVANNYLDWVNGRGNDVPTMSHNLFKNKALPVIDESESTFFILIDNLRYDQWKVLQPSFAEYFKVESEEVFYAILPTATQYARNAIFAGLMPLEIEKRFPKMWMNDDDEGGKNQYEEEFLADQLKRLNRDIKFSYNKITNHAAGRKLVDTMPNLMGNRLNVIVYNFVDMLSHARTEMEVIRELADDEAAYRSITQSWFEHSPLLEILKKLADKKCKVIITTDHGTVHVKEPSRVIGDRNTNTNLRYKQGKNLQYEKKDVFEIKNPHEAHLPRTNVSQTFIFAKEAMFFAYPNNFNYYVNYYRNTFQHGGISLEEMIIPFIVLGNK